MQRFKLLCLAICLVLVVPSIANAESLTEQKQDVDQKQLEVQNSLELTQEKIEQLRNNKAALDAEIKTLDASISETSTKLANINAQIKTLNKSIAALEAQITTLQEKIKIREELIRERLVLLQENGWNSRYMEVIFGAQSFSEFIERMDSVRTLLNADEDIIKAQVSDKEQLATAKSEIEKRKAEQEVLKASVEAISSELNQQKANKVAMFAALGLQEDELEGEMVDLQEQKDALVAQEKTIKKLISDENERKEKERIAKEKKDKEPKSSNSSDSTPPPTTYNGGGKGIFQNPCDGVLTSGQGARWGRHHDGIDIAKRGYVGIHAAADGVVSRSYYSSSYGNCIMINHNINGKIYTTVYGHMSSRLVGDGATVSKGQQIGVMGSTGRSTGQHLHFEVWINGWNSGTLQNPLDYVSY